MGDVTFPSLIFSWDGKQPMEKVVSKFVVAAEANGWKIEERDSQIEKIWNINDIFRPEYTFAEDDELARVLTVFGPKMDGDVGDGTRFKCASKTLNPEGKGEYVFEIWLQPFHLVKGYDSCDLYLLWKTDSPKERRFIQLHNSYGEEKHEVVTFLRSFKNELLSTKVVKEILKPVAK